MEYYFSQVKKRIVAILVLMSVCVTGITALQLYWNYQNYQSVLRDFTHDSNTALEMAVNNEMEIRRNAMVRRMKQWLNDTSFVQITCNARNRHHETVFRLRDTHPVDGGDHATSIGINKIKEPLDSITPEAKRIFIDHFADVIVREDLRKGVVFFYTQRLGDSLGMLISQSRLNPDTLRLLYTDQLVQKNISAAFTLNPLDTAAYFLTRYVNAALRGPYEKEMVRAALQKPGAYFLHKMRWLIISSFLLIIVTLLCYGYTLATLLSQHKLSRLKDDFISNMTHELNTPLSAIKISAEALQHMEPGEQRRAEYLAIIVQQADKLTALSEQILQGQQAPALQAGFSRVSLHQLLKAALDDLSAQVQQSSAVVTTEEQDRAAFIKGDAAALKNALVNLLDNAIKYHGSTPRIHLTLKGNTEQVILVVADEGIGIPKEYHGKIFDKFFRVPKGNTHDVKGYGLGLSYVAQVVTAHQGRITVSDGAQDAGTVFTLQFPRA